MLVSVLQLCDEGCINSPVEDHGIHVVRLEHIDVLTLLLRVSDVVDSSLVLILYRLVVLLFVLGVILLLS